MKNKLTILFVLASLFVKAQSIADFENIQLSPQSVRNGKDSSDGKGFLSSKIFLNVHYDTAFGYWDKGFAISNKTDFSKDSATTNYTKMYHSITGNGAEGTQNYAIGQTNSDGTTNAIIRVVDSSEPYIAGCFITNSNYSWLSMKYGDFVGKKFGDSDFFHLSFVGFKNGLKTDTVLVKLADGKNVLSDWKWIDLFKLGKVDSVKCYLSSSDTGTFGMNTPAFFCIDQIKTATSNGIAVNNKNINLDIFPNPASERIFIHSDKSIESVTIIDLSGRIIINTDKTDINISNLQSGSYVIQLSTELGIISRKLIKQ